MTPPQQGTPKPTQPELILAAARRLAVTHPTFTADDLAVAAGNGTLRRNFQGYTTDTANTLLGVGASSIGSLPQGYVQNRPSIPDWLDAVRADRLPIARGIALTGDDRLRREAIERIMCDFAVDLRAVAARHALPPSALMDAAPALQAMERDGLVAWNGYDLSVTEAGRPFVRTVAAAFDRWLQPDAGRHSRAI